MDNDGFVKPSFVAPKPVKADATDHGVRKKEMKKKEIKVGAGPEGEKPAQIEPEGGKPAEEMETEDKQTGNEEQIEDSNRKIAPLSTPKAAPEEPPVLQYKEPKWSGPAAFPYTLEVLKGGQILEEVDISESCVVTVGRLPSCDVPCLHPSISRYHALFQHRSPDGDVPGSVFVYDLGSSYGTIVNKVKISPKTYYMLKTGYVIKFGASTRLYIVKGPPEEAFDDEKEMVQELIPSKQEEQFKKLGILASEEAELMLSMLKDREKEADEVEQDEGAGWGFREDAPEEDDGELRLDLALMNKPADFKDPKKTLRGYFEREGVELEFTVTESGLGKNHTYICKVELPLDTPAPVVAEGTTSGKKKDAVLACALHGCRLLDAYGVLRSSKRNEDIETRNQRMAKNDFYDSDEDTFTDRTGEVEQKRKRRMLRAGVEENKVTKSRTHDMLTEELKQMNEEIVKLQQVISASKKAAVADQEVDELEAYMATVAAATVDSGALREARKKLFDLKQARAKLERLCEMAKPIALPEVKRLPSVPKNITTGKVGKVSISRKLPTTPMQPATPDTAINSKKRIKIDLTRSAVPIKIDLTRSAVPTSSVAEPSSSETLCAGRNSAGEPTSESAGEKPVSPKDPVLPQEPPTPITEFSRPPDEMDRSCHGYNTCEMEGIEKPDTTVNQSESPPDEAVQSEEKETLQSKSKQADKPKKQRGKKKVPQGATLTEDISWDDDLHDANFVNWTPPVGQSGDGRTKLNEKYGY